MRGVLETWLLRYPVDHRRELVSRLRDPRPFSFDAAFFELYLHELFVPAGYEVEVHPSLPSVGSRHPDFRLTGPRGETAYVEALLATDVSRTRSGELRRVNRFLDAVEAIRSPNYFLGLRLREAPNQHASHLEDAGAAVC